MLRGDKSAMAAWHASRWAGVLWSTDGRRCPSRFDSHEYGPVTTVGQETPGTFTIACGPSVYPITARARAGVIDLSIGHATEQIEFVSEIFSTGCLDVQVMRL